MEQERDDLNPQGSSDDEFFDKVSTEESEREVEIDLPKGNGSSGGAVSLEEAENSPNTTDMQAVLQRLFPKFKDKYIDEIASVIMVADIAPDVFLDMIYLTVTDIVEEMDADGEDISVQAIINKIYAVFSIGRERRGRIDSIQLAGAAREAAELENVAKGLGLN